MNIGTNLVASDIHRDTFRRLALVELDPFLLAPAGTDEQSLRCLLQAADAADEIFWKQSLSGTNRESLIRSVGDDDELKRMIMFHYGPYDRLNGWSRFIPGPAKPLGAGFYPPDFTREKFVDFLVAHPDKKRAFNSPYTVIQAVDSNQFRAVPYHEYYQTQVAALSRALSAAARIQEHNEFRQYLERRAEDVLTDDFHASESLWVRLRDNPIDLVIGPYEVYEDRLLGIKAAYEAMLLARDFSASDKVRNVKRELGVLRKELEKELNTSIEIEDSRVELSVATLIYTGGEARSAIPAIAFNLPNDEQVIEEVGARQILLQNVLEAKFRSIAWPIVGRLLDNPPSDEDGAFLHFFNHTLYHEIAHSLGPHRITVNGESTTVNSCLKQYHTVLEEVKADVLGACLNLTLADAGSHAALIDVNIAGFLRSARFGVDQAHGGSNVIQFNYLLGQDAVRMKPTGCLSVQHHKARRALFQLAAEVLAIQERGDFEAAERFVSKFRVLSPEIRTLLDKLSDIPIDIRISYKQ
jgi:Peptidase family M49